MRRVTAFFLLLLFASAPSFAAEQSQGVNCTNSDVIQNKQKCDQLNVAWQMYVSASTLADHRKLFTFLDNAVAADQKTTSANEFDVREARPSFDSILAAHEIWLRWFVVTDSLADTDRAALASDAWRALLASAHRDPYAALAQLNKQIGRDPNSEDQGLKLLLAGMITNNLSALLEASSVVNQEEQNQKFESYVAANKRDFSTGELCYGSLYNGRHYGLVEKNFKPTKLAAAAAYLSTRLGQCGECEGIFDCYLNSGMDRYDSFLRNYPQSQFSKEILQQIALNIRQSFNLKAAQGDYLSADQYYSPAYAAATLTRFESALKDVEPQLLIPIKALLGELYAKLNQPANARRVADWLAQYATGSTEQLRVEAAVADMKTLELRLKRPTSHGPNIIALSWEIRPNYSKLPMQLWRAEDMSFSNPQPISNTLPAGTLTAIDRDVKPDACYWYRLATIGKDAKDLSHAAFAQTWNSYPLISSLVFDNDTRSLMATGWLQGNDRTNFVMKLQPNGFFEVGRIFSPHIAYSSHNNNVFKSPRPEPYDTTSPTWWIDRGAGLVVKVSPSASGKSGHQNLNPAIVPRDVMEGAVEDTKRGLLSYSPFIAQAADGKSLYVWEENILRRQEATGTTVETVFDEPHPHPSRANDFRGIYLFLSKTSEVWLLGSTRRPDGNRQYILRRFGKTGKNTFNDVLLPEDLRPTFIDEFAGWLYDPDENGIWLAEYKGRPALFGFDGKLKRTLDTGAPEWRNFLGHALARDPVTKSLFVANREEVLRFTRDGKVSSIWKAPKTPPGGNTQTSCPAVTAKITEINRDIEIRQCEINAMQMKSDATSCKAK
jgi:hypothetical protein